MGYSKAIKAAIKAKLAMLGDRKPAFFEDGQQIQPGTSRYRKHLEALAANLGWDEWEGLCRDRRDAP